MITYKEILKENKKLKKIISDLVKKHMVDKSDSKELYDLVMDMVDNPNSVTVDSVLTIADENL